MRLASHLGMPLRECIACHTYREYLTWQAWLDEQYNHPDRTDHYLMEIAAEVRRVLAKNPNTIKAEQFKLTFRDTEVPQASARISEEDAAKWAKVRWGAAVGLGRGDTSGS